MKNWRRQINKVMAKNINTQFHAKPFLKWAGGKTQLISELESRLPEKVRKSKKIKKYIEPFIGGGAMYFYLKNNYEIKEAFLFDINEELVLVYNVVKDYSKKLIKLLSDIESTYLKRNNEDRKEYYYEVRQKYNQQMLKFDYKCFNYTWILRTAYLLFLNKTCFNGLFRQNKKGEFNVPHGKYNNPKICDKSNIIETSKALKDTQIICGDFDHSRSIISKESLVYLDPPYRPLSNTSSFNGYHRSGFTDEDQTRLASFYKDMTQKGAFLMLSNSDPKNENIEDDFFDDLYKEFIIDRVPAKRIINCDSKKRGEIKELIIRSQ